MTAQYYAAIRDSIRREHVRGAVQLKLLHYAGHQWTHDDWTACKEKRMMWLMQQAPSCFPSRWGRRQPTVGRLWLRGFIRVFVCFEVLATYSTPTTGLLWWCALVWRMASNS